MARCPAHWRGKVCKGQCFTGCKTVISVFQVTVILKHVFAPAELEQEPTMKTDLEADMTSECAKLGPVDKVSLPGHLNTCMSLCSAVHPSHKCHTSNNSIMLAASVCRHFQKDEQHRNPACAADPGVPVPS